MRQRILSNAIGLRRVGNAGGPSTIFRHCSSQKPISDKELLESFDFSVRMDTRLEIMKDVFKYLAFETRSDTFGKFAKLQQAGIVDVRRIGITDIFTPLETFTGAFASLHSFLFSNLCFLRLQIFTILC